LCRIKAAEVVYEGEFWRVVVNQNQNLLGKCFIALKRHEEDPFGLRPSEQAELWNLAAKARQVLTNLFQADHFNFAFLGDRDRHVHLDIIPRYRGTRFFAGLVFDDKAWGHHYDLIPRRVPPEVVLQLVGAMREPLMPLLVQKRRPAEQRKKKTKIKKTKKPKKKAKARAQKPRAKAKAKRASSRRGRS
jgi:diadenosine tetraphosphate (Ap4A) HIT family hydrolase